MTHHLSLTMQHDPEVQHALNSYQLGLPRVPLAGRTGELLGRGAGSSLEFQEHRQYMPGDDIRHLDWAAYARSDALMIRLFREEISPRTEILLDASRSMTSGGPAKPLVARQLAALLALLSGQLGGRPSIVPLDDAPPRQPWGIEALEQLGGLPLSGLASLQDLLDSGRIMLRRQAIRIVISDFLFPHDPGALIRRLAAEASTLWVIQLLDAWEADPRPSGGRKLIDAETGSEIDLVLDRKTIAEYKQRLDRLREELSRSCRRVHAPFVTLIADEGLPRLCREGLCPAGLLRPA